MTDNLIKGFMGSKQSHYFKFDRFEANAETRTISATVSSDQAVVERWFGKERLSHKPSAVDLSRTVNGGLPLVWNHDSNVFLGKAQNIRLDGGTLRADLQFASNARAQEAFNDANSGLLDGVSVSYQVKEYINDTATGEALVTRWMPYEVSLAPVPADTGVGIGRSDSSTTTTTEGVDMTQSTSNQAAEIVDIFAPYTSRGAQYIELMQRAIKENLGADASRSLLLDLIGKDTAPTGNLEPTSYVTHGEDEKEKFARAAQDAIEMRAGLIKEDDKKQKIRETGLVGWTMAELARKFVQLAQQKAPTSKLDLFGRALTMRGIGGHTTSDFANILANVANKSLMAGWAAAPETFDQWTKKATATDFKTITRTGLGEFPTIELVPEGGNFRYGTIGDRKETYSIATYGKLFNISRQALINDDLSAFDSMAPKMARAAKRLIGNLVYDPSNAFGGLMSGPSVGPTLVQDSTALFDAAGHANYVTSGAAPSVTTLNAAFKAMATQTDNGGSDVLNLAPTYIIAGYSLRATIMALLGNVYDPAATAGTLVRNPYYNALIPVFDARIDAGPSSGAGWYLAANPNVYDTIEIAYLDGMDTPYLETSEGWTVDGLETKVRIDAGVGFLGYQGLYYNDGA